MLLSVAASVDMARGGAFPIMKIIASITLQVEFTEQETLYILTDPSPNKAMSSIVSSGRIQALDNYSSAESSLKLAYGLALANRKIEEARQLTDTAQPAINCKDDGVPF